MFIQCKWILICETVIVLFLHFNIICAMDAKDALPQFAGIVENITVHVLEKGNYLENDMLKLLTLNVSWMPPSGGKQPSSYSVMIMSIRKENDINEIECPECSETYIAEKNQFSQLIPQGKLLNGMPDMQIRPNCIYKIQVYANPRAKPVGELPEVNKIIYTVPKCVGHKCSCGDAKTILPVPKVTVIQVKGDIIVNWNITSNYSYVRSYVISIGVPLLIGHFVYNITQISNVTSATNTFTWDSRIDNQHVRMQDGYKILVAAMDHRGCLGTQGDFVIIATDNADMSHKNIIWPLIGIVICAILVFISCISICKKNKYQLLWLSRSLRRRQAMPALSVCKSQWPDMTFQKHNVLYLEQRFEESCYKAHENEFEIPYTLVNLMYELGKGQFGRVYLGSLKNNEDILVAVKVSQCVDASNELEARRQLLEEIETMKIAGSHPHLVKLLGCCTSPNSPICILLEYMEGGDLLAYLRSKRTIESDKTFLRDYVQEITHRYVSVESDRSESKENPHGTIERQMFMKFALDIARGMAHLEAKEITHRDLAARNILLTGDLTLKISDFGLSRNGIYVISNTTGKVRQLPIRWMSPEAVRDHTFSSKSDVWSYGIVLWEIGTLGSFPYPDVGDDELLRYLTQNKCRLTCPNTISCDVYEIMHSCWDIKPLDRPSFAQLILDLETLREPLHSAQETSNPCYTLLPS